MNESCDASTPYYASFVKITDSLRCPVCAGQRISSSDVPFALTVKRDVCKLLHEGMSVNQTINYIETAYGSDLHVEEKASIELLPLFTLFLALCILGIWIVRKIMRHAP
jgi:cytochrome c-type biogenesis protein CcmH